MIENKLLSPTQQQKESSKSPKKRKRVSLSDVKVKKLKPVNFNGIIIFPLYFIH